MIRMGALFTGNTAYDVREILAYNSLTEEHGLALTREQAVQLAQARQISLQSSGRVEFGSGILEKLITLFRDSPHLTPNNYADILAALMELFYYYKTETHERVSDDALLAVMRAQFDEDCHGSTELLAEKLDALAREIRSR